MIEIILPIQNMITDGDEDSVGKCHFLKTRNLEFFKTRFLLFLRDRLPKFPTCWSEYLATDMYIYANSSSSCGENIAPCIEADMPLWNRSHILINLSILIYPQSEFWRNSVQSFSTFTFFNFHFDTDDCSLLSACGRDLWFNRPDLDQPLWQEVLHSPQELCQVCVLFEIFEYENKSKHLSKTKAWIFS